MTKTVSAPTKSKSETIAYLNQQVANWTIMYIKIHQLHWYVKGSNFFTLHTKFEELYKEADANLDTLAERILALEGNPLSTTKEFTEYAAIQESKPERTSGQMVEELIKDLKTLSKECSRGFEICEKNGDEATHDMLVAIQQSLDTHIWMFESYLSE